MSRVLVVNSGSSSLKFQLIDVSDESTVADGLIERIGESGEADSVPDHAAAFQLMLQQLEAQGVDLTDPLLAVGHRVVHGGEKFVQPTVVTEEVEAQIEELFDLAPLHNPPNLLGIREAKKVFPTVPQVAVFDTAFHSTLPEVARAYAIDSELAGRLGVRRFGFHGISFEYVAREATRMLSKTAVEAKLIILHLGNGASVCAVRGGKSVETSMGLTPLEGLVMGTRGGDIDPGALLHLQRKGGLSVDELDDMLNHRSGLLGMTGFNDIRDVQREASNGNPQAIVALELYCHRIRGYVGNYFAQLGGADAIVFTAGVGEHNPKVRALALAGLESLGVEIDDRRNQEATGGNAVVSTETSSIEVFVIPTDEELEIARQAADLVTRFD